MLLRYSHQLFLILLYFLTRSNVKSTTVLESPKATNNNWGKNAVIYQIYTRTFRDKSGDGIGDFQGIIEKLNYLKETGITAIWLPPIFEGNAKPKVDFGYEVVNYKDVDKELGKLTDFQELIEKAHNLGIKIILEFVPNHSSLEHLWFKASSDPKNDDHDKYENYYVWAPGQQPTPKDIPPNNWKNHLGQSAWTYEAKRDMWYLHQFAKEQPDLNYHEPPLKTEIENALGFWLDEGVDGFLIDSPTHLVEDRALKSENVVGEYTQNQEGSLDLIQRWRSVIDEYNEQHKNTDPRILITNAKTVTEKLKLYCGNGKGANFTLNNLLLEEKEEKMSTAAGIIKIVENWINNVPPDCRPNWMLGSHDQHRMATKYGPERADGMNTITAFLPGIMLTYNGEEIGQENGEVQLSKCKDPIACQATSEKEYQLITKDLGRTPFHWTDDKKSNAGFSSSKKLWLPLSEKYVNNNLQAQNKLAVRSHYHTYRDLIKLRQTPGFADAVTSYQALKDNVIGITKTDSEGKIYIAVINIGKEKETIDLSEFPNLNKNVKIILASSASKKYDRVLPIKNIVLEPYESFVATVLPDVEEGDTEWWKQAVIYQIFPLSFKDSNNDGYGDIQGIISRLSYLKGTGITAIWISHLFKSSKIDEGYDIIDFKDIDEHYGVMVDFEELIEKAHEMGMKIIIDFVPNHSSNQHEWFKKSENKEANFEDFYIWRKGKGIFGRNPPNNWISLLDESAWTYKQTKGQLYLHQFASEQPDLNFRNPVVRENMKDILKHWLSKGVDGFRIGAVPYLYEDDGIPDEPSAENGLPSKTYDSLKHIHTKDQSETFDLIYDWRDVVDDYTKEHGNDTRIIMTEAYTDIKTTMRYYGNEERNGAHFTFNFQLTTKINSDMSVRDVVLAVKEWLAFMPLNRVSNWLIGNHDVHRAASRLGSSNVDGYNMLIGFLPGVMITYNGEEIGQEDGEPTVEDCKDRRACKSKEEEVYKKLSRDFERTPFHWNWSTNAGFNEGAKPWLPISRKYPKVNLDFQSKPNGLSHYNVYKQLLQLRKEVSLTETFKIEAMSDNVLLCVRVLKNGDIYVMLFNIGNKIEAVSLDEVLSNVTPYLKIVLVNTESPRGIGDLIPSTNLIIGANEAIIAKYTDEVLLPTTEEPEDNGDDNGGAELAKSFVLLFASLFYVLLTQ